MRRGGKRYCEKLHKVRVWRRISTGILLLPWKGGTKAGGDPVACEIFHKLIAFWSRIRHSRGKAKGSGASAFVKTAAKPSVDAPVRPLRSDITGGQTMNEKPLPKVLIAGGGFGGLSAAKALAGENVEVTLLDRANHHLFQPLLYQVATAALSPAQIAQPLRHILRDAQNVTVEMGEIVKVEPEKNRVVTHAGVHDYDFLILATGARHSYFGHPEWEKFAPGLKSVDDAVQIRNRMLIAFEHAERCEDEEERRAALTFVVVGAGPTGVEMAGAIGEIARYTMVQDFRRIDPSHARVILVDASPRVLQAFPEHLSEAARQQLERIGVEVRPHCIVKDVTEEGVSFDGEFIRCQTVVWAAGNEASPLGKQLGVQTDRAGRVPVLPDLTVAGHPNIFVIGDLALFIPERGGKPLPGVSPVAIQQGRHAARNILARLGHRAEKPFVYVDRGSMATVGRHAAVADIRGFQFQGYLAWLAWLFVHLVFLIGFRNRMLVLIQWAWSYINYYRGARLITGIAASPPPAPVSEKAEPPPAKDPR